MVDNTLPALSLEVKPTEVPSELLPQMTHSMMEGNEDEKKKAGMTTMWMRARERRVVTAPLLRRHHAFLGYLSAKGAPKGLAFP